MTQNQIRYAELKEAARHNLAGEVETNRSNVAREVETNRHNIVSENETVRHNISTEGETNRHNVVDESIRSAANAINASHYMRSDAISKYQAVEQARHNVASETSEAQKAAAAVDTAQAKASEATNRYLVDSERNDIYAKSVGADVKLKGAQATRTRVNTVTDVLNTINNTAKLGIDALSNAINIGGKLITGGFGK